MKPRPDLTTLSSSLRTNAMIPQCHRRMYHQTIAPSLTYHIWHDASRNTLNRITNPNSLGLCLRRHASTSTAQAAKVQYGREAHHMKSSRTTAVKKPATHTMNAIVPSTKPTHQTMVSTAKAKENLNPPSFTYAADLAVPSRQPDEPFYKYIWKAGRAYLAFYKAGVSNVRQTHKLARSLRSKASKHHSQDKTEVLTRAEWQVIRRSRQNMIRLPAFAVIFLVFGEWTPLLVLYMTPLVPEACRIPNQVKKELTKLENKRKDRLHRAGLDAMRLISQDRKIASSPTALQNASSVNAIFGAEALQNLNPLQMSYYELFLASAQYDCHSRIFDIFRITPPKFWLQRGVRKRFTYLRKDDELISRDGGVRALEKQEVEKACTERGIDVLNKREDELRKALSKWYGHTHT